MNAGFVYDPLYLEHKTPEFHPESPRRLAAIISAIEKNRRLAERLIRISPRPATRSEITAIHDPLYFEKIDSSEPGYLDGDTYLSSDSRKAALLAAGAVLSAVEACRNGDVDRVFCAVRPPGHHAERHKAMGFCIFNNVAVGAEHAITLGYKKPFIVDFDVHHGNGTQHSFYDRPDVFYFSTHQYYHYPGTGAAEDRGLGKGLGATRNFPLRAYSGDSEYAKIYNGALHRDVESFDPDIILVSAGYDIREEDPLASMNVTNAGIRSIVEGIVSAKKGIPLVFTLEGGYDLHALAESVVTTLEVLLKT